MEADMSIFWRVGRVICLLAAYLLVLGTVGNRAMAGTLEDIVADLSSNADAVNDISANMTVDADDNSYDVTSGWVKAKDQSTSGTGKFRVASVSPASANLFCDGTNVWEEGNLYTRTSYVTSNHFGWLSRAFRDCDIRWLLDNNTFTLVDGTVDVSGVTCRKITSTNYDIYVDNGNYKKPIRIEAKESGNVKRRYTMSNYSYVENTAYVAASVVATDQPGDNTVTYTITYSSISINDSLANSVFELP